MTPNPTNPNPTLNCSKNVPPKSQELPHIYATICKVGFEVGFNPAKKRKNELPCPPACLPPPSSMTLSRSLHHHTTVTPPPPPPRPASCQPSSSSTSAGAHLLIVVFLSLSSAPLSPLCHRPSAASLQPPLSSKQSLLHLLHRAPPFASHRCPLPLSPLIC
jgi:hypothetical protein